MQREDNKNPNKIPLHNEELVPIIWKTSQKRPSLYIIILGLNQQTFQREIMNRSRIFSAILFCCTCLLPSFTLYAKNNTQDPDSNTQTRKTVVLTFDDATASQRTFVAPLLKKMGFGATFFVCEFKGFENKKHYMSWSQIRELAQMGFEIGNHTHSHPAMSQLDRQQIEEEIRYIENKCQEYGIAHPITFAYPGYSTSPEGIEILRARGYRYARHGNDKPYIYGESDPMMVPSYAVHEKDNRTYEFVRNIIEHVNTSPQTFKKIMKYLKKENCRVIPLCEL